MRPVELANAVELLHWQYSRKKLVLFDTLDIEERLSSQEGQRAESQGVVISVEEVDCVKFICEDKKLVVLAFWNQQRIAHRSSITAHRITIIA